MYTPGSFVVESSFIAGCIWTRLNYRKSIHTGISLNKGTRPGIKSASANSQAPAEGESYRSSNRGSVEFHKVVSKVARAVHQKAARATFYWPHHQK